MDIKQALIELSPVARELDGIDSTISCQIRAIEQALERHLSVRIRIDVPPSCSLHFGKHDAKWCFIYGEEGFERPLLSCSRQIRADMLAGGHIERLVRDASMQIGEMMQVRQAAVRAAARILSDLESP